MRVVDLPVITFPPTAATFLTCLPANHRSISWIWRKTLGQGCQCLVVAGHLTLQPGWLATSLAHSSSRAVRVRAAPSLTPSPVIKIWGKSVPIMVTTLYRHLGHLGHLPWVEVDRVVTVLELDLHP